MTVITVEDGERLFAFAPAEVARGGMYVPDFNAFITLEGDAARAGEPIRTCALIRERLAVEPEQSFERASREISSLDPTKRQGSRLYRLLRPDREPVYGGVPPGVRSAALPDPVAQVGRAQGNR